MSSLFFFSKCFISLLWMICQIFVYTHDCFLCWLIIVSFSLFLSLLAYQGYLDFLVATAVFFAFIGYCISSPVTYS